MGEALGVDDDHLQDNRIWDIRFLNPWSRMGNKILPISLYKSP